MNSPVALKMAQRAGGVNSGGEPDARDQLLLSNILTKSLGMPPTISLNQRGAGAGGSGAATKKHTQEGSGIFKILKDFEE